MKERPILFSGPMVRAILDGRKTQTRRLVEDEQIDRATECVFVSNGYAKMARPLYVGSDPPRGYVNPRFAWDVRCPYGAPGDSLWVRETWQRLDGVGRGGKSAIVYRAHCQNDCCDMVIDDGIASIRIENWRPSIHMPRRFSRLALEVTSVRVERLHEISEEDARAEGARACDRCDGRGIDPVRVGDDPDWCEECGGGSQGMTARDEFSRLWDDINGKRATWSMNPWVWAVSFRRAETQGAALAKIV